MSPDDDATPAGPADDLEAVYRSLKAGAGRERVTDANVAALIALASERGDATLEYLLREWRSPCGDDAQAPPEAAVRGLPPAGAGSR